MSDWPRWISKYAWFPFGNDRRKDGSELFRLLRFFSAASLVAIFVAAALFILFIRKVAVQDIIELSERNNLVLTQAALNSVKPELLRYLSTVENVKPGEAIKVNPPEEFTLVIEKVMHDTAVARIKLYNRLGTVVFSTEHEQVGEDQEENDGFQSAIKGKVKSVLIYRDTFNSFDQETEDDNLISTYIPIRNSLNEPPPGVFEVYTDATSLVIRNERTEFVILLGVGLILGFLYAMLLLIVRRASNIIDVQQQTIRERTTTLEILSAHLLTHEERDKKKIAMELHEGLVQTLCTLKIALTSSVADMPKRGKTAGLIEKVLPVLQQAIEEVQAIAQGLRPSSLDTLGLLPTLDWVFRNFARTNPEIRIEHDISLQESDIPTALKVVIFRIVETVLRIIAGEGNTERLQLNFRLDKKCITLEFLETSRYAAQQRPSLPTEESSLRRRFTKIHEQTILSGGAFSVARNARDGGIAVHAVWPLAVVDTLQSSEYREGRISSED